MRFLGNFLWFLLCGFWTMLVWAIVGLLWCVTLIGIPIGIQCFKMAGLAAFPFGKSVVWGSKTVSTIVNIFWLIFGGIELALSLALLGIGFCVTIVGIPFGLQCFKLAKLALMPFGATVERKVN